MSLYFCAITNRKCILCKNAIANRDYSHLAEGYLHRNPADGHFFYAEEGLGVHAFTAGDISFVAVTDLNTPRHQPLQFINDLANTFASKSRLVEAATDGNEGCLQPSFGHTLKDMMGQFDKYKTNIPMTALQKNVEGVTNILRENLNELIKRGEMADTLVGKTAEMEDSAKDFQKITKKVETHERAKHRRLKFIVIGVGVAILFVILFIILWQAGAFKAK